MSTEINMGEKPKRLHIGLTGSILHRAGPGPFVRRHLPLPGARWHGARRRVRQRHLLRCRPGLHPSDADARGAAGVLLASCAAHRRDRRHQDARHRRPRRRSAFYLCHHRAGGRRGAGRRPRCSTPACGVDMSSMVAGRAPPPCRAAPNTDVAFADTLLGHHPQEPHPSAGRRATCWPIIVLCADRRASSSSSHAGSKVAAGAPTSSSRATTS